MSITGHIIRSIKHQFNVFDVEEQKQASVLWMFKADNSLEKLEESMLFSGLSLCCLLVL